MPHETLYDQISNFSVRDNFKRKRIPDLGRNQILYGNQFAFDFGQISFIPMLYRYIREHHVYPNSVFVGQKTEIHENFKRPRRHLNE